MAVVSRKKMKKKRLHCDGGKRAGVQNGAIDAIKQKTESKKQDKKRVAEATARTICIPIVDGAKCVEALLTSCVPDGKIDGGGIYVQALTQE